MSEGELSTKVVGVWIHGVLVLFFLYPSIARDSFRSDHLEN